MLSSEPIRVVPVRTLDALVEDTQRIMSICNACRYCEGYCAVFPAMERRLQFGSADLNYLANLCHNCGACYTACQYAPPHEFAVNVPGNLAQLRLASYEQYAWPSAFARWFRGGATAATWLTVFFIAVFVLAAFINMQGPAAPGRSFYDVIPHGVMALSFGGAALFVLAALVASFARFWRDGGEPFGAVLDPGAVATASHDALRLTNLGGGGEGCDASAEAPSTLRRRYHHLLAYGFGLCFAATVVATFYHYVLGLHAPYPLLSVPVVLGTVGGIGMIIGGGGLWWLARHRNPVLGDPRQTGMNESFIALLLLTSVTGLALLALRGTAAMPWLLAVHLGVVMALFLTLPYGKFVHATHRFAALLRNAIERQRPSVNIGSE